MVTGFLIFYSNVEFIVTRCLAVCLGLPRFTGPTNKTQLESYWVHTFAEIMICKRSKKDRAKGKQKIGVLSWRAETQMPRTSKNWTQRSKENFPVRASSSGYQDKLCLWVYEAPSVVLRDWEKDQPCKWWSIHFPHVQKPSAVTFVKVHLHEIRFLIHLWIKIFMLYWSRQMVFSKSPHSVNHAEQLMLEHRLPPGSDKQEPCVL